MGNEALGLLLAISYGKHLSYFVIMKISIGDSNSI